MADRCFQASRARRAESAAKSRALPPEKPLLEVAVVTDRTDPKLVHLDGLNLSRAWCMRSIAKALPQNDPSRSILTRAAAAHAQAALPYVASGNYEGEHWLASFAVYLLTTPSP